MLARAMRKMRGCAGLVVALGLACSNTRIVDSWSDPGLQAADLRFEHVVAIAAVANESRQRLAEDALAAAATRTRVTPGYRLLSHADRADSERLRAVLEEAGVDGAVTVRLVGVEEKTTYVPGSRHPVSYWTYWGRSGAPVYDPGYYRDDTIVVVETTLHDVRSGRLLWAGTSRTLNPDSVADVIEGVVASAAKELRERGLIP